MKKLIALIAFVSLCSACRTSSQNNRLKIIDGTPVEENDPIARSTVMLGHRAELGKATFHCSASLIAADLVLTAAHCIDDYTAEQLVVRFGTDFSQEPVREIDAAIVKTHERYNRKASTKFDIAWIRLKASAPSGFVPIELLRSGEGLQKGVSVTLAGAGLIKNSCQTEGCNGRINRIEQKVEILLENAHFPHILVISPEPNRGSCFGDSGGPALLDRGAKSYLVGVFHGWDRKLTGGQAEGISNGKQIDCEHAVALYTYPGNYIPWIEETARLSLAHDDRLNPTRFERADSLMAKDKFGESFQELMRYTNYDDELWKTASSLLIFLRDHYQLSVADSVRIEEDFDLAWEHAQKVKVIHSEPFSLELSPIFMAVTDARPIAKLVNLEALKLVNRPLPDYAPLSQLINLKKLQISAYSPNEWKKPSDNPRTPINLGFLASLAKLEELDLTRNLNNLELATFPRSGLGTIKVLNMAGNSSITDISKIPWELFTSLEVLTISNSKLTDVSALSVLPRLKELNLENIEITNIDPLANIHSLETLNVVSNKIESFEKVMTLPNLRILDGWSNKAKDQKCAPHIRFCNL